MLHYCNISNIFKNELFSILILQPCNQQSTNLLIAFRRNSFQKMVMLASYTLFHPSTNVEMCRWVLISTMRNYTDMKKLNDVDKLNRHGHVWIKIPFKLKFDFQMGFSQASFFFLPGFPVHNYFYQVPSWLWMASIGNYFTYTRSAILSRLNTPLFCISARLNHL